jgi:hypothetical protein
MLVVRKVPAAEDTAVEELRLVKEGKVENLAEKAIGQLKKRKWVAEMWVSRLSSPLNCVF